MRPIQLIIIGAPKAGTTTLQRTLGGHPDICTHTQREMNFFIDTAEYRRGYSRAFRRYFRYADRRQALLLAKSVEMMYDSTALGRLKDHNPSAHLLVTLRNPIERAYSAYWYARRMGWEDESFETAIKSGPLRIPKNWVTGRGRAYLDRGEYVRYLNKVFQSFSRSQVHIFLLEEVHDDITSVCQTIFRQFEEVDDSAIPAFTQNHNKAAASRFPKIARILSTPHPIKHLIRQIIPDHLSDWIRETLLLLNETELRKPPIDHEIHKLLANHYRPLNQELSELIDRDLSHWDALPDTGYEIAPKRSRSI